MKRYDLTSASLLPCYAYAMNKKQNSQQTPKHLQLAFLLTVVGMAVYSAIDMFYRMAIQHPSNPNLSSFMGFLVGSFLYPVLLVGLAYFLMTRKISWTQKLYEAVIVAIIGASLYALTNYLFIALTSYFGAYEMVWTSMGAFWTWSLESLPSLMLVITYLLIARKKGQW